MLEVSVATLCLLVGVLVGAVGYGLRQRAAGQGLRERSEQIIAAAKEERDQMLRAAEIGAKERLLAAQQEQDREAKGLREELGAREKRLRQRETNVERKNELIERREGELRSRGADISAQQALATARLGEAQERLREAAAELERVAGLSRDEARQRVLKAVEDEARQQAARKIETIERAARAEAEERANKIIAGAIQRLASSFVSEKTISVVELPSDDMKGRIIGREGRNIRAIEAATGVDVIIDDTPEVVVLSAFNPVRREIAKLALERLIADGRIHPARIEEVVQACTTDMDDVIVRHGEQATFDLGLHGLHPELIKLLGQLKYRVVNGQNLWDHVVETAAIAGMMATELGLNPRLAKRAGLLHDIGRAVGHEVEGSHAEIAAAQARRFGERREVVEALGHCRDTDPPTVLAVIVQAACALSHARPGARREVLESYVKRLEDLERTALSFDGVDTAYAIQSGREVRVMVNFEKVSDSEALVLSGDIARRIEDTLTYPGEVRVTVIREARATEIAR